MNQANYKMFWQISCWTLIGVVVCAIVVVATLQSGGNTSPVFSIIQSLLIGGAGCGLLMVGQEIEKIGNANAVALKSAGVTLLIGAGLALLAWIFMISASGKVLIIMGSLLVLAAAAFIFMVKDKLVAAINGLSLPAANILNIGILVYAAGQALLALGVLIFAIAVSSATYDIMKIFTLLGGIASIIGSVIWFFGMFQATSVATK